MFSVRELVRRVLSCVAIIASRSYVAIGAARLRALFGDGSRALRRARVRAFVLANRLTRAPPRAHGDATMEARRARCAPRVDAPRRRGDRLRPRGARGASRAIAIAAARDARVALPGRARDARDRALRLRDDRRLTRRRARASSSSSSNPYLSDLDRAREVVLNLVYFVWKVLEGSAVARPPSCGSFSRARSFHVFARRTREVSATVLASALLFTLLVSINGAARFQGFRYYAPAVALLVLAVAMGVGGIARRSRWIAIALGHPSSRRAAWRIRWSIRFFVHASENIHDQQRYVGEVARNTSHSATASCSSATLERFRTSLITARSTRWGSADSTGCRSRTRR